MIRQTTHRFAAVAIAAAAGIGLMATLADARPGGSGSSGSRGSKTFQAPPSTNTAPGAAAPMQKSITQPGQVQPGVAKPSAPVAGASAAAAQAAKPSLMRNLLLGGLMGAGLAMMFGSGPMAAVLGFILQTLLIGGLIALAVMFFRSRRNGGPALATAASAAAPRAASLDVAARQGLGGGGAEPPLQLSDADFGAFERLLADIQLAYGRSDLKSLEMRTTPEMLSYFAAELDANRRKGVRNEIAGPKLLQGDLSEAWSEGRDDYATVAMRYTITDATVEIASDRVIAGSRTQPEAVTEIWTFRRPRNGGIEAWELSAIQQTA